MRLRAFASVITLAACLAPGGARAGVLTQDPCAGVVAPTSVWKDLGFGHVLENLLFADGALWVSDGSSVRRYDAGGAEGQGLKTVITSAGGLATDGEYIYAGSGNSLQNSIMRTGAAKVLRFLPDDPAGSVSVYAEGFNMPNGMTFGPDGDLFISNDFDAGLIRIPAENPGAWALLNDTWGANGLAIVGNNLYSAITFDQRSPIEVTDLTTLEHHTAVQLTAGAASLQPEVRTDGDPTKPLLGVKGLDDMTRDAAGLLYPVANGTGELLRVDPVSGEACLIAGGLQNPSSVKIAPESGPFADGVVSTIDFYITEFSGAIKVVRFTPSA